MQTLEQLKRHVEAAQPGFLYEPRAFWDVGLGTLAFPVGSSGAVSTGRIEFDSDNFYNGSKYPIVLTDICLDPAISQFFESAASAGLCDGTIRIASSGNQYLTRDAIPLRMLLGEKPYAPPSPYAATPVLTSGFVPKTGLWGDVLGPLWGVTQWNFHHPLVLPKDGAVTFSLGARIEQELVDEVLSTPPVTAHVQFFEGGDAGSDFFKGNTRAFGASQQRTSVKSAWGDGDEEGGSGTAQPFPPTSVMSGREYQRQNITQAGTSLLHGFSVLLDQRAFDDFVVAVEPTIDSAVQSRASTTPVKARTANCGTQEAWWRDGAPLSLVSPSRTNALTGKLPVPITLQPGDALTIEMQFNVGTGLAFGAGGAPKPQGRFYVGLSFTGFAAIEN